MGNRRTSSLDRSGRSHSGGDLNSRSYKKRRRKRGRRLDVGTSYVDGAMGVNWITVIHGEDLGP